MPGLFFAGATAGCIETIVHTTGGGFRLVEGRGVSPSNPEKIKKSHKSLRSHTFCAKMQM